MRNDVCVWWIGHCSFPKPAADAVEGCACGVLSCKPVNIGKCKVWLFWHRFCFLGCLVAAATIKE